MKTQGTLGVGACECLRVAREAWTKGRTHASLHAGLVVVVAVFWASFTIFIHPVYGLLGFAVHAFAVLPRSRLGALSLLCAYPLLALWFAAREPYISLDEVPFHQSFGADSMEVERTGIVKTMPAGSARGHTFLFRESRTDGRRGLVFRVSLESATPPRWGSAVTLRGLAGPADAPLNPGQLDMRRVLRGQGASAALRATKWTAVKPPQPHLAALEQVRSTLDASFTRHVPTSARPLLEASLLNITSNVSEETKDAFLRSGMQHILAISGQHIGLLLGFLMIAGLCARLPRKATFLVAACLTAVYIPLVGSPVSVVRSGIMFVIVLPSILLERPSAGLHALGLTASADLLLDPHNLLNLGFQLSYAATLALILGATPAMKAAKAMAHALSRGAGALKRLPANPDDEYRDEPIEGISSNHKADKAGGVHGLLIASMQMIILSALITLFTYPVLAASTHATTPWGVVGNVATVPVGAAMLVGGLFTWCFDALVPMAIHHHVPLASWAGATAGLCALLLEGLVFFLADLPGALRPIAHPPDWWTATLCVSALTVAMCLRRGRFLFGLLLAMTVLAAEAARPAFSRVWDGGPRVTFLAVGHGDAAVLELPGATFLIDAGESPRIARNIILPYLQYRGIARLEAVIITHPDRDHYGGAAAVLERLKVDRIIAPPYTPDSNQPSKTWECLRSTVRGLNVPWVDAVAGQRLYTGRRDTLWALAPDTTHPDLAVADKNDRSLVTLLRTASADVLFTGDIEHAGQRALAASWPLWRGAWLKAPHHGSDRTTFPCFLEAVAPPRAVVSCGKRRGFPGTRVMATLQSLNTRTAVTKYHGAVTWTFGRHGSRESRFANPNADL